MIIMFRGKRLHGVFLGVVGSIMALIAKPAMSQEMEIQNTQLGWKTVFLATTENTSTKAEDLLLPELTLARYFTDTATRSYQLAQLNLEQFCQDFPDNSQCRGTNPEGETSPNSIPVPVPPPAPPEGAAEQSDRTSLGNKSGWAIVPEISTLGLGGHVVTRITPQINARVGINAFGLGLEIDDETSDISANYDADLKLFNVSTIADYHPFRSSGFKFSGGLVFNNNNVEGTATTDEEIEIGDVTFDASELGSVDVDVEVTRSVAPYLGIGWGNAVAANQGLGFWLNLGVMFGGSPEIEITPNINDNVPQSTVDEINTAVAEEEKDVEDELDFISIYPVGSLGISYQF